MPLGKFYTGFSFFVSVDTKKLRSSCPSWGQASQPSDTDIPTTGLYDVSMVLLKTRLQCMDASPLLSLVGTIGQGIVGPDQNSTVFIEILES